MHSNAVESGHITTESNCEFYDIKNGSLYSIKSNEDDIIINDQLLLIQKQIIKNGNDIYNNMLASFSNLEQQESNFSNSHSSTPNTNFEKNKMENKLCYKFSNPCVDIYYDCISTENSKEGSKENMKGFMLRKVSYIFFNMINKNYNIKKKKKKSKGSSSSNNKYLPCYMVSRKESKTNLLKKTKNSTLENIEFDSTPTFYSLNENEDENQINNKISKITKNDINAIEENSIENFNCALSKKILIQGKIFITCDSLFFIPFFNKIFFKKYILHIKYEEIDFVRKLKFFHIISNSLKIITKNASFIFMFFARRNNAFDIIIDMLKESRGTHSVPKKGVLLHADGSDSQDEDKDTNINVFKDANPDANLDTRDVKKNSKCSKSECASSSYVNLKNHIHVETVSSILDMNVSTIEQNILSKKKYINCKYRINSLYINKNFKNIFLKIFANFDCNNPIVKSLLNKKAQNFSYDDLQNLNKNFEKIEFLTHESIYSILLFEKRENLFGLPQRSDVKEILNFFFFKNMISIQKSNTLLCKLPIASSFRTIITINIHDVFGANNHTQIDFLYDVEFMKHIIFKNKIEHNILSGLKEFIMLLKEYTVIALEEKYKKINVIKKPEKIKNEKKNQKNENKFFFRVITNNMKMYN